MGARVRERGDGRPGRWATAGVVAGLLTALVTAFAVVGAGTTGAAAASGRTATATRATAKVLRVLVTNDDGVGAPGINAAVQALRTLSHTSVTVVAPLTTESGTGGKTTPGKLTVTDATTAAGYPAKAVHGYPADTIVWAITDHGVKQRPDLVVSGINFGQNIGPTAAGSGTVGAARAAFRRGIPALAASQGVDDGQGPNFAIGAKQLVAWVQAHRAALLAHRYGSSPPEGSLNVPTCANGTVRGPVHAPVATSLSGIDIFTVACTSTSTSFTDDAQAFVDGYAVISPLYPTKPKSAKTKDKGKK